MERLTALFCVCEPTRGAFSAIPPIMTALITKGRAVAVVLAVVALSEVVVAAAVCNTVDTLVEVTVSVAVLVGVESMTLQAELNETGSREARAVGVAMAAMVDSETRAVKMKSPSS